MRIRFDDDELRRLYQEPSFVHPRIGLEVTRSFRKRVLLLANADSEVDLRNYRALRFEKLKGDRKGQHSIRLNQQWRVVLRIEADDAGKLLIIIEIVDYH